MTATAALETWNEKGLRRELLRIARHRKGSDREKFYGAAWSLITRLRAGRSPEYYLARVVTELCPRKTPQPVMVARLPMLPKLNAKVCHWGVSDTCVGANCARFKAQDKTCLKDQALFERLYGPGAPGPARCG